MPTRILTKKSSQSDAVPTAGDLFVGELAVNVADKRLYTKDSAGGVVEIGTNPTSITAGSITTETLNATTSITRRHYF